MNGVAVVKGESQVESFWVHWWGWSRAYHASRLPSGTVHQCARADIPFKVGAVNIPPTRTTCVLPELESYSDWGVKPDDVPKGVKVDIFFE